ncbi:hypothetical protein M0R45_001211 [Rubus argutus]|uniref:ABC-2 type transporter transmembrane domain-containing protein n=1 Tax=Rubus argutus TaxID=59490 RepID=A0AAW1VNL3_RUBAR
MPDLDLDLYMKAAALEGQQTNIVSDFILKVLGLEDCADIMGLGENVLEFFECMGFKCPERKGVCDFLQEVTSRKDQEQYWVHMDRPYSFTELFKACMARQILLTKRNSFIYIFELAQLIIVAVTTMTLFFRTEMDRNTVADGGIYMGALFYTLLTIMLNGFAELLMTVSRLPVFFKQRDHLFYPAWAYALPTWMIRIPITFVDVSIWVITTYYAVGYDPSSERFFKHFLLLLCTSQMVNGLYRLIGALGRNITIANTFGFVALLVILGLGGFILPRGSCQLNRSIRSYGVEVLRHIPGSRFLLDWSSSFDWIYSSVESLFHLDRQFNILINGMVLPFEAVSVYFRGHHICCLICLRK